MDTRTYLAPLNLGDLCLRPGFPSRLGHVQVDVATFSCRNVADNGNHIVTYISYKPDKTTRKPVLCVHGLTRNASDFDVLARRLAHRGHAVVAIDVVGRRWSEGLDNPKGYCQ